VIGYLTPDPDLVQAFRSLRLPGGRVPRRGPVSRIFSMAVKLTDLFSPDDCLAVRGSLDRPISGLVMDSRRVAPGNLFFALPGLRSDGARYIEEAIERGAVAIVSSVMPAVPHARVTYVRVLDPRTTLARVARRYFREPDRALQLVGVTGTNGKTTVAHLVRHFLAVGGSRVGLLGTIHYDLGQRTVPSFKTTPESLDLYGMLAQMRDAGCTAAAMEVSSHGLEQKRVLGMEFAVGVFTNLTRDHLDYHRTLENYFAAKCRLFDGTGTGTPPRAAVVNLDDAHGRQLAARLADHPRLITFGESPEALVRAEAVTLGFKETTGRLVWPGGTAPFTSPLIGRYNVSNLLAAVAAAHALGRDPASFLPALATFRAPAGRMERIEEGQAFNVLVDYAHTDDALRNALGMLRAITPGRLLVVFGCGGNRDRAKRPLMTRAVQEFADLAWATADNPRSEPLAQIFDDMRGGIIHPERIQFVEERRRAISLALDAARPGDSLLVAGKGHETFQEFADTVIPFDDRQVLRELIQIKSLKHNSSHAPV
jgi:UDP-N-acetylmuramoyl-L-alanyl-D-glutamate--2,6-diaminopimelate ligase